MNYLKEDSNLTFVRHKPKILIVDDDEDIIYAYKFVLENKNYLVTTCSSGIDCLSVYFKALRNMGSKKDEIGSDTSFYWTGAPFDVVIIDYKLPDIDGIEVAKRILSKVPDQRLMMITAYMEEGLKNITSNLGYNFSIEHKPLDSNRLLNLIEHDEVYDGFYKLKKNVTNIDSHNMKEFFEGLRKIHQFLRKNDN